MKRCPQCEFIYEDDQSHCDMDGTRLNHDTHALPKLQALTTTSEADKSKARGRSVSIDHERGWHDSIIHQAFSSENDGDVCLRGGRGDRGPRAFEERSVRRQHLFVDPVAGHEAFRKTDDAGARCRCACDGLLGQRDRLIRRRRKTQVREGDAKQAHLSRTKYPATIDRLANGRDVPTRYPGEVHGRAVPRQPVTASEG